MAGWEHRQGLDARQRHLADVTTQLGVRVSPGVRFFGAENTARETDSRSAAVLTISCSLRRFCHRGFISSILWVRKSRYKVAE